MRKIIFAVLFSCTALLTFAQADLVELDLVQFQSDMEKNAFTDYVRKGKKNYFMLFMASGSLLTDSKVTEAENRFYSFLEQYKDPKFQTKKPERKSKQIHEDLQKTFLIRLQDNVNFEEIFRNGDYSNISAVGLYAISFDHVNIPFSIRDEADQLFILTYPNAEKIKLELTMNGHALIKPSIEFKQQYVQMLRDQKLITDAEFSKVGVTGLFDKFFYGNNEIGITIPNLIGLQYYNQAVLDLQSNRYANSFNHAEKAYLLYPSPKTSYLMTVAGTNAFNQRKQLDSIKAVQLAKLSKYEEQGVTPDIIEAEFIQISQELLFNRSDKTEMDKFHKVLNNYLTNVRIKNDVNFVYFYETGRFLYNRGRYTESVVQFEEAYKIKPTNQNASNALINAISWKISRTTENKEKIKVLEHYLTQYPTLTEDNNFNNLVLSTYLLEMMYDFDAGNVSDGEKYRALFEQGQEKFPDVATDKQLIGNAYSRAAVYYYRKGQTQKAKAIIDAGLKQSPNNYELLTRKNMIR